jgi:hypothetical protein
MLHWFGPTFPIDLIYGILNFLVAFIIISIIGLRLNTDPKQLLLILVTLLFPFLINGMLIDWHFIPDQSKYLKDTIAFRSFDFGAIDHRPSIYIPSLILALTPLPFLETFNDLGFANRLIMSLFIMFLINKQTPKLITYYLILSPTILFYTSTGLKETIVIILTTISFYLILKEKLLTALLPIILLILSKKQNGYLVLLVYLGYLYFFKINFQGKKILSYFLFFNVFILLFIFNNFVIDNINYFRFNFFVENGGKDYYFNSVSSVIDLFLKTILGSVLFLLSPLPDVSSIFKISILGENLLVLFFMVRYILLLFKLDNKKALFWILSFLVFISMYGLTIFNHGTISRYKISFMIPYLFVFIYLTKQLQRR